MEKEFINSVPAHVDYITLNEEEGDQPWSITIAIGNPDLLQRIENALVDCYDVENIKITKLEFTSISMLGRLEFSTICEGEEENRSLLIGTTTVY